MEVSYVCPLAVPDLGIGFFLKKNLGRSGGTKNEAFRVMTKI